MILEGSDSKKKYVPAPKKSDFESDFHSDEEKRENADPNKFLPASAASTLDREWEYQSSVNRPDPPKSSHTQVIFILKHHV